MFRRLFDISSIKNGASSKTGVSSKSGVPSEAQPAVQAPLLVPAHPFSQNVPPKFDSFEEIYRSSHANLPRVSYSILKVADMLNSPHLAGMSMETKRGSVMMALEAAGVELKDMFQDAMLRTRALDDYEAAQQKKLQDFGSVKTEANGNLQA